MDETDPLKDFNPLLILQELKALVDEEPSEEEHLNVFLMEKLAKQAFRTGSDTDEDKTVLVSYLTTDHEPQAVHALACDICMNGILSLAVLYR